MYSFLSFLFFLQKIGNEEAEEEQTTTTARCTYLSC